MNFGLFDSIITDAERVDVLAYNDLRTYFKLHPHPDYYKQAWLILRVEALEAGTNGQAFKLIEKQRDQQLKKSQEYQDFLKDEIGFYDFADARKALKGETVPKILKDLKKSKDTNDKVWKDINDFLKSTETKHKPSFNWLSLKNFPDLQGFIDTLANDVVITRKWFSDKGFSNFDEVNLKLTQDEATIKTLTDDLKTANKNIATLTTEKATSTAFKAEVDKVLLKYKVNNIKELDTGIDNLIKDRDDTKRKLDSQTTLIKNSEQPFKDIVDFVNKKLTIIANDPRKKEIKKRLNALKSALGWDADIDTASVITTT